MKKLISLLVAVSLFSSVSFADCDFSKGITQLPDGNYEYTKSCNQKVGQIVQYNTVKDKQIQDLTKAISLKDLTITTADQRADNWMTTAMKLEADVQASKKDEKLSEWAFFGLGVLTTFAAGYTAAKLAGH